MAAFTAAGNADYHCRVAGFETVSSARDGDGTRVGDERDDARTGSRPQRGLGEGEPGERRLRVDRYPRDHEILESVHGVIEMLQDRVTAQQLTEGVSLVLGQLDALAGAINVPLVIDHQIAPTGLMNNHADEAACVRLQVEANPHTGQISLGCLPHWSLLLVIEATTAILTESARPGTPQAA